LNTATAIPVFTVRLLGAAGVGKSALATALMEMPVATDEELARLAFSEDTDGPADAWIYVARGLPSDVDIAALEDLKKKDAPLFVAVHARDLAKDKDDDVDLAWTKLHERVFLTATPPNKPTRGADDMRAALLETALSAAHVPIDRARRAKRPFALSVIAGAALVTAAEGLLPGAAAFVVATQAGAISSLYYLYTGKWMARSQAFALLPAFAAEAAGGSVFLLVKSFLPPTGVLDVLAAGVAASMTITVLGTIAWALDQGYSLEEKEQMQAAFKKMRARSKAERKAVAANRHRWNEKEFWVEVARRVIFPK
jgi:uncharacterized protein